MLTIHYFASIREALDKSEQQLELPQAVSSVGELVSYLAASDARLQSVLDGERRVLVAVNQTVVGFDHSLSANDEIAFFPPMTGG